MADVLNEPEVDKALRGRPAWELEGGAITRSFEAADFLAGIALVGEVGRAAELAGHHPDIDIRYTTLTFVLVSHSDGGLTEKDFAMAGQIDQIIGAGAATD